VRDARNKAGVNVKHRAKWSLPKLKAYYRSWVESKTNQNTRDEARKKASGLLAQPDEAWLLAMVAAYMDQLGQWESSIGVHEVLTDNPNGWRHLLVGVEFQSWRLRIKRLTHATVIAQGRKYPVPLIHGATSRCLAAAIVLRNDQVADWCGGMMLDELAAPSGFLSGWGETPFHPLMMWLYATWRGRELPPNNESYRDFGVYQPIVTGWRNDKAFQAALLQACDYHCTRHDPDVDDTGEFWPTPLDVFPGEILATLRVRRELLGVEVMVSHPLLDSPLCAVPDVITHTPDPLLHSVADRVLQAESNQAAGTKSA
jgi:hypothetical protein